MPILIPMSTSDTRRRIVAAVRGLHEEVGPAATTISGIAERAGVQRLTVYRHFPDESALVHACAADWKADHPLPDPAGWSALSDPTERLRTALAALYGYFRRGAPMLERVLRDEPEVPALAEVMTPWWDYMREASGALSAGWGVDPDRQRRVRAAVGHALDFTTWRSLAGQGLDDADSVGLMVRWVEGIATPPQGDGRGR